MQEPDAARVGFVRVGDTVAVLHNSSSNFSRCQLKRKDGLVGWTHAFAPGGQRVLNMRDPGTKQIAAIPIEGLAWQIVSKKELQLTTGKGQRVTLTMVLPPSMIAEQLEAKAAELTAIKSKAAQIGEQAHKQWKSTHFVSVAGAVADNDVEYSADSATRPHREELEAILDDVQQQLQSVTVDERNAQHVAVQCLMHLGRHPPKVWWLEGLSTVHTDMVIWAEDIASGEATHSPQAVSPAAPFPGADPPERQANGADVELGPKSETGEGEPEPEPELEPEPEPELEMPEDVEMRQQDERRLPIMTLEEQVFAEAQAIVEPEPEPEGTAEATPKHKTADNQPSEMIITDDNAVEEQPELNESAEKALVAQSAQASGEMPIVQDSSGAQTSAEDFHAVLSVEGSSRRARMSDATLRRRREFAARQKRQLAAQSGPNDYSTVGFSALRDPDVAQLVSEAMERDRRVDEMRHRKPVYRDIYSRRRRRGVGGRGDHDVMMLPIHLPAQQPSLRDGLDVARAPRAWTLSRPHSREGVYAQASRGAYLSVNIPRPNSRASVGALLIGSPHLTKPHIRNWIECSQFNLRPRTGRMSIARQKLTDV